MVVGLVLACVLILFLRQDKGQPDLRQIQGENECGESFTISMKKIILKGK